MLSVRLRLQPCGLLVDQEQIIKHMLRRTLLEYRVEEASSRRFRSICLFSGLAAYREQQLLAAESVRMFFGAKYRRMPFR